MEKMCRWELQLVRSDHNLIRMEHLDELVAASVRRALAETGIGVGDLVKGTSIPPSVLRQQLAAEASFTLSDLVGIAAALGWRTIDLLPDVVRPR